MAEHSMWLTGDFKGDNLGNVEWECSSCHVRIPSREEAVRHVRSQHSEAPITPHLSSIGLKLASMYFYGDASERLSKQLVTMFERRFCTDMGANPLWVTRNTADERSVEPIQSSEELFRYISKLLIDIRHKVEQGDGYISLTNANGDNRALRSEAELQVTLEEWLSQECKKMHIDTTREGQIGRGLLDFKFTYGTDIKCFLEVKKFDHPKLQHGLEIQLPTYLRANHVRYGLFVPIAIDPKTYEEKLAKLQTGMTKLNEQMDIEMAIIDIRAWKPDSASIAKDLDDASRYQLPD